ncbi:hypothetical protein GJAV_G00097630 [Gymnothorax javanicus]|nr:hypothetical protein GJAV_G00097630 [Gymnothorax javanicus]
MRKDLFLARAFVGWWRLQFRFNSFKQCASEGTMNNLNDPSDQKVWPDKQGGGDDKKKYTALPVLMLGLAFYRWVWERDTRKRIQEVESRYKEEMKITFEKREVEQRELNQLKAVQFLNQVKEELIERQNIYCSHFTPRDQRLKIEKKLLDMVAKEPLAKGLNMEADLKNIF